MSAKSSNTKETRLAPEYYGEIKSYDAKGNLIYSIRLAKRRGEGA